MISIVARFKVSKEQEEKFLKLVNSLIEPSRAEAGCIEYIFHKDVKDQLCYCMIEKWKDQAAIDLHNNTPHFTEAIPKIVKIAEVEINVYEPV